MCSGECNGECGCERVPRPPSLDANIALWRFRYARFRLLKSQSDEVESGSNGPSGSVSIWSWSPLFFGDPLNLVLYMPFRIFAYSSNIFKAKTLLLMETYITLMM